MRLLLAILLTLPCVAAPGQGLVKHSGREKTPELRKLAERAEIESLDSIYPLLTDPDLAVRSAAAKAYTSIPEAFLARMNRLIEAQDREGILRLVGRFEAVIEKPQHRNALGLGGRFLLRVLNDEKSPNEAVRRKLLLDLLKEQGQDARWEVDKIDWGSCIASGEEERAVQRMALVDWQFALELILTSGFRWKTLLIEALAESKRDEIRRVLVSLLKNPEPETRRAAVEAIGRWEEPEKWFREVLRDPYVVVRQHVVYAIDKRPTPEALRMLLDLAFDGDAGVRERADEALAGRSDEYVGWVALYELRTKHAVRSGYALELLAALKTPGSEELIRRIASEKGHPARAGALTAMARFSDEASERTIVVALDDPAANVVLAAIGSVVYRYLRSAKPALERLVRSRNVRVAEAAADAVKAYR